MKRAAALLAPLLLTGCFGGSKSEKVIPWIPDRPAVPHFAVRLLARPCRANDLHASLFFQGAGGALVGGISLKHVGQAPCALIGRPAISFVGSAARHERWVIRWMKPFPKDSDATYPPQSVLRAMRPGEEATVQMTWRNWCGPNSRPASGSGPPPRGIVLTLPHNGGDMNLSTKLGPVAPRCDAPDPGASSVQLTSFLPAERYPPASSHIPLEASIVGGKEIDTGKAPRFRLAAGKPFQYRVALTNVSKRPFRFKSCPAYLEGLASRSRYERYVLNCRPVGTLAPGERVVFTMVFHVPADARPENNGLSWELGEKTAQPSPFADAAVLITR